MAVDLREVTTDRDAMKLPTLDPFFDMISRRLEFADHVLVTDTIVHTLDCGGERDEVVGFIYAVKALRDGRLPDFSYTETPRQKWERGLKERHLVAEHLPESFLYRVRKESTASPPSTTSQCA